MTTDEWRYLNYHGILCSPSESLEEFHQRTSFLKDNSFQDRICQICRVSTDQVINYSIKDLSLDLEIDRIYAYVSHKRLSFWELAATWIIDVENVQVPLLQLRSEHVSNELLRHEAVHIARSAFKEPLYEEFLAYATSKTYLRRIWGPLVRSSQESLLLVIFILIAMVAGGFSTIGFWAWTFVGGWLGYLSVRLFKYRRIFINMLKKVCDLFDIDNPLKIAIRLSDQDIHYFGTQSLENSKRYIQQQKKPYWQQILSSYSLRNFTH